MKVRFDQATAAQLRSYLKTKYQIERHETATRKTLLGVLRELGEDGETFETGVEPGEGETDAAAAQAEAERAAQEFDTDLLVQALVAQGMDEPQAVQLAGMTAQARVAANARETGERPYGPGKEHMYVTVRIGRKSGKFGDEPIPLGVNGSVVYVPRDIDWPIRTPYLEVLMHAEQIEYDEIMVAPDQPRVHVPRKTLAHPVHFVSPAPYDRSEAMRVANQAQATLAARGNARAIEQRMPAVA